LPEGDHSSVGGHGILGSASSSLEGVSTLGYPSGLADPLDSARASEGQITAESTITTAATSSSNEVVTSRQPPTTAAEVTAAAFSSPTQVTVICPVLGYGIRVRGIIVFWRGAKRP